MLLSFYMLSFILAKLTIIYLFFVGPKLRTAAITTKRSFKVINL